MQPNAAQEFFSWSSLGTVAGATAAVVVVANTLRRLLKLDSPWVPFLTSVAVTAFVAYEAKRLGQVSDYFLVFLNACLLFCAAAGLNQSFVELKPQPTEGFKPYGKAKVSWLSPWLRRG